MKQYNIINLIPSYFKMMLELNRFFFETSPSYMDGHSKKHYYSRLPKAYLKFMCSSHEDVVWFIRDNWK